MVRRKDGHQYVWVSPGDPCEFSRKPLGFDDETLARIAGPVGLPLGGRSPAEIAVSILAQIIQSRYQSS